MQTPIIVFLTLAYTTGLLLGHGFLYFPYSLSLLVITAIIISGIVVWFDKRPTRWVAPSRFFLVTIPCLMGMAAYLYSAVWLPSDHYTRVVPDDKSVHSITGRIISALDRDPDRTGFVLDVQEIDDRTVSGKVRVSVREALSSVGYGDIVRLSGKLYQPGGFKNPRSFDYAAYLAQSGIYRTVSVKSAEQIQVAVPGSGIFRKIQDWRERIRQSFVASTSGPGSAILRAMVLGEEGGLTDEIRDRFLAAGVTHIISISGSHLGMVAVICFGLLRLLMRLVPERMYHLLTIHADPKKIAAWITVPLVIFYSLLAGAQMATIRSLMMVIAALAALILDRENALLHSLAAAALLILMASPQALFDISFQLSFISVMTIGCVVMVWIGLQLNQGGTLIRWGRKAALLVVISISTSVATGPIVAHYFNQFSLAGIISNIFVVPFAGMIVVPLGLFSGILSLFMGHLPLAGLNQIAADWFVRTVTFFSRMPIAEFHPPSPGIVWLLGYAALVISLFLVMRARLLSRFRPLEYSSRMPKAPLIAIALSSLLLIIFTVSAFFPRQSTVVAFPDVGQGDCTLIQLRGGRNLLIDGGGTYDGRFDMGRRILAPFLWNRGVRRVDLLILSHPHPDHMNGLKFILKKFEVAEVWTHGMDSNLPGYDEFEKIIREMNISRRIVSPDVLQPSRIGEAELRVLHPGHMFHSPERKPYAAENDRSLVVRIVLSGRVLLFTGDIGIGAEKVLIENGQDLKCDLIKIPHHGSKSSSSEAFVSAARPSTAVATVGRGNTYHHPSAEVLERYERIGTHVCRTDRGGAVFVRIDENGLRTTAWNDLELKRIEVRGKPGIGQEQENWKRVWLRKWEF